MSNPDAVLWTEWAHGYRCLVMHNGMGFRCGYIAIPRWHPWHSVNYDEIEPLPDVHGGLTYSDSGTLGSWWIGFDCAHFGDAPDPALPAAAHLGMHGRIHYTEDVISECVRLAALAEQAESANAPHIAGRNSATRRARRPSVPELFARRHPGAD